MRGHVVTARRTRRTWWIAVVVVLLAWLGAMPTSGAAFRGTGGATVTSFAARSSFGLIQTAPCFSRDGTGGCTAATGIPQSEHVVVSPDGAHVYTASLMGASVAAFSRHPTTGALTQLAAPNSCVSNAATPGCTVVVGLAGGVYDLAISPDGKHVYATGYTSDAVAAFSRDPASGVLTQLAAPNRCVTSGNVNGCTAATGLNGADGIAISPDGAHVYVASYSSASLTVFARDATSGALTQLAGTNGCLMDTAYATPNSGCLATRGLRNPYFLHVSPDGTGVYVAAIGSNAITVLHRDPATGVVTQPASPNGCVYNTGSTAITGCTAAVGLQGTYHVQVAPDSRTVYAVGYNGNTVAAFTRNPATSVLTQLAAPNACRYDSAVAAVTGCTSARGISAPTGLAFSPDGRYLFVSAYTSNAVAIFRHDNSTGVLTQSAAVDGCIAVSIPNCATASGVQQGLGLTASPDGRDVYSVGGADTGTGYVAVLNLTH
jgi:6-phosphogluconolactonase (cycloisomerase 2 family)